MPDLKDKLKKIPSSPGVYFWLGKNQKVLYVGRATSLKNRLGQYFQKNIDPRIAEMVAQAQNIKVIKTDSVLEAIILEAQNIKKYWPKYNIKDRDDRSFIYIIIPKKTFTCPIIVRGRELEKTKAKFKQAKIFGPYQSQALAYNALKIIRRIFPYSTCETNSGRACFDYQIGLCPGACLGIINAKEYQKNIASIVLLLSGKRQALIKKLIKANPGQAQALKHLQDVSLLTGEKNLNDKIKRIEAYDISHLSGQEPYASMVVFSGEEASKNDYRLFKIKEAKGGDDERALTEVLGRRFKHQEWPRPDIIMVDGGAPQVNFVANFLSSQDIKIPLVGISKYGGDKLVFSKNLNSSQKKTISILKASLLQIREEAHRFAISAGRRARRRKTIHGF